VEDLKQRYIEEIEITEVAYEEITAEENES
jgi:hypothetical protein